MSSQLLIIVHNFSDSLQKPHGARPLLWLWDNSISCREVKTPMDRDRYYSSGDNCNEIEVKGRISWHLLQGDRRTQRYWRRTAACFRRPLPISMVGVIPHPRHYALRRAGGKS